jgi:serine/threonine-protein kinase
MSPEQLLGEELNVCWDLWALSVVAYETVTGNLPFPGTASADGRRAILAGNFTPVGTPWQSLFARLFAEDRSKRPQSAEEFFEFVSCLKEGQ